MNKKITVAALSVLLVGPVALMGVLYLLPAAQSSVQAETLPAAAYDGELSEAEIQALYRALDDEYKALATYQSVMATFGQVRPFVNIARAEQNHISALVTLFERYSLPVPENDWAGQVPQFESLAAACQAGVQAEIENAALYDELFASVDHADITRIFQQLRDASQEQHLPAFQRCAR